MDLFTELPMKLASGLISIALILMALRGPPSGPSAQAAQLEFPFMLPVPLDSLSREQRRQIAYARAGLDE